MWNEYVIDATMGARDGLFCFCPIERGPDGEIENIVTGMNFVGSVPHDGRVVAVVHEEGQDAVEAFCEEHKALLDEVFTAQADRSPEGQDGETRLDRNDESAVAESDAPKGESRG